MTMQSNPVLDLSAFSEDERRVFHLLAERVDAGRKTYGPLHLASDSRNFRRESIDERVDALFYDLVEDLRRRSTEPVGNDLKSKVLADFGYTYNFDRMAYVSLARRIAITIEVIEAKSPEWLEEQAAASHDTWAILHTGDLSMSECLEWTIELEAQRKNQSATDRITSTPSPRWNHPLQNGFGAVAERAAVTDAKPREEREAPRGMSPAKDSPSVRKLAEMLYDGNAEMDRCCIVRNTSSHIEGHGATYEAALKDMRAKTAASFRGL